MLAVGKHYHCSYKQAAYAACLPIGDLIGFSIGN